MVRHTLGQSQGGDPASTTYNLLVRLLLTGVTGNVGSHTLPALLGAGHEVRCLVPDTPRQRRAARRLPRAVEPVLGDVRDADAVRRACTGVEAVVHLAAVIPPA